MSVYEENRCIKDNHLRLLASKFELKRNLFKALVRDPQLPIEVREKFQFKLSKLPRNSSFTRVRNRCIFTGRPRAVYQLFRMSRIVFRELASQAFAIHCPSLLHCGPNVAIWLDDTTLDLPIRLDREVPVKQSFSKVLSDSSLSSLAVKNNGASSIIHTV